MAYSDKCVVDEAKEAIADTFQKLLTRIEELDAELSESEAKLAKAEKRIFELEDA